MNLRVKLLLGIMLLELVMLVRMMRLLLEMRLGIILILVQLLMGMPTGTAGCSAFGIAMANEAGNADMAAPSVYGNDPRNKAASTACGTKKTGYTGVYRNEEADSTGGSTNYAFAAVNDQITIL